MAAEFEKNPSQSREERFEEIGRTIGGGVRAVGRGAKNAVKGVAHASMEAWHDSARLLFEQGRMRIVTSNGPVFYNEGVPKRFQGHDVSVSIPLKLDGRWYPATKNRVVLRDYDPEYPQVILRFEHIPEVRGDEVLRLEPRGKAFDRIAQEGERAISWHLYAPGSETVMIRGGGEPVIKPQIELTAPDIVQVLNDKIFRKSRGKLVLNEAHLHAALRMITSKSESLRERWKMWEEFGDFQRHLVENPWLIASIVQSMGIGMEQESREAIRDLALKINNGKIQGWSSFLQAVDEMDNFRVASGAAVVSRLWLQAPQVVPGDVLNHDPIPASIMTSIVGMGYFNRIADGYKDKLSRMIEEMADKTIHVQKAGINYINRLLTTKANAWRAATEQLRSSRGDFEGQIEQAVIQVLKELEHEIVYQIGGRIERKLLERPTPPESIPELSDPEDDF